MCGICGCIWTDDRYELTRADLTRMNNALAHRGPDDSGEYLVANGNSGVALGHRRLSIIDLDSGHQPMSNPDQSMWIVFNGEIYNYRELRHSLAQQGVSFRTNSDTEVLLRLYERDDVDCLKQLRGMFAFAIWNSHTDTLFLARDRFGQKPLVYRHDPGRFLFASELKSLLQVPEIPREVRPEAIDDFLTYQYVPHPESILKGFQQLPPGYCAEFHSDQFRCWRYWSPPYQDFDQKASPSFEESCQTLREKMNEAVSLRLRSDVPLGAFLSGGIDSTIIVGLMQEQLERPVETFSIGFEVEQFDERSYARMAAEKLGTNHHEFVVSPSAIESLPKLIWHYDEPFSDSSAIPTMALSEVTRSAVTVALTGDAGDELFAGYDRYQAVRFAQQFDRLPGPIRKFLSLPLWQKMPSSGRQTSFRRRAKRCLEALSQEPRERYLRWIGIFDRPLRNQLYSTDFQKQLGNHHSAQFLVDAYQVAEARDFVTQTSAADVMSYLPCDILKKVDIASMSVGLECRSPFLDHQVAEFAARLPIEYKIKQRQGKFILRETFKDFLPEAILTRPKMGFGVPIDHWFRHELRDMLSDILLSQRALERGYFEKPEIERLINEHQNSLFDHSYRLWGLLVLECWHRMYLDSAQIPLAAPNVIT